MAAVGEHEEFGWGACVVELVLEVGAGFEFDERVVVGKDQDEFFTVARDFFPVERRGEKVGELRATRIVVGGGNEDGEIDGLCPVEFEGMENFRSAEAVTDDCSKCCFR